MPSELWTIDQLTEQAANVLRSGDRAVPSGRVREVPDARTVRWYQTTGLVDRPAAMRGRTALYGRRHLLQLIAIKRLQTEGKALADIQAELAGVPDATLEAQAGSPMASSGAVAASHRTTTEEAAPLRDGRFWAARPMVTPIGEPAGAGEPPGGTLAGLRVDAGLALLIEGLTRPLSADDAELLRRAARPVVEILRRRGLVTAQPMPYPPAIPRSHHEAASSHDG